MKYLCLVIFPFLLWGFNSPPKTINVDLDNPLSDSIVVNMDGIKAYALPPRSMKTVKLKAGKHTFDTKKKGIFYHSGYFDAPIDGLLNVTHSEYVVWKDLYMKEEKEEYYDNIREEVVLINGREYIGDIKLYDSTAIFIPKDWDYGVRNPFPENVSMGEHPFLVKKKIFYKNDFIREYNNM